jgi:hypothetical protein
VDGRAWAEEQRWGRRCSPRPPWDLGEGAGLGDRGRRRLEGEAAAGRRVAAAALGEAAARWAGRRGDGSREEIEKSEREEGVAGFF